MAGRGLRWCLPITRRWRVRCQTSSRDSHPVVFVNIGGISNITYVPESGDPVAFDTGPGNTLIDQWVSREGGVPFDAGGAIASEGGVVASIVERYLDNPFFEKADRNLSTATILPWSSREGSNSPTARAHWPPSRPRRS